MSQLLEGTGRILTFYSYKGGTGRSMALANMAWLLASHGQRVLVIDWDLEAPGLHRYFRPFLDDPELQETPGLIDYFSEFMEAARMQPHLQGASSSTSSKPAANAEWHAPWIHLERFAVALEYDFPNAQGALEFVGAGRQGKAYAQRVNDFDWVEFYEKAGGGILLEAVKKQLRQEYDFILVDSRTGISDTSGICTVQLPDELVVCYTLNRQSIFGAAATAESAALQRRKPSGEPGLKIWPVATRIELAEKQRLDRARALAQERFASLLWHLNRRERASYWSRTEILYYPFYAYEEILATIADRPGQTNTLLECMDKVLGEITRFKFPPISPSTDRGAEQRRRELMQRFEDVSPTVKASPTKPPPGPLLFLSYVMRDWGEDIREFAQLISIALPGAEVFYDELVPAGADLEEALARRLEEARVVLVLISPGSAGSTGMQREVTHALEANKVVVPLFTHGLRPADAKMWWGGTGGALSRRRGYVFSRDSWRTEIADLLEGLKRSLQLGLETKQDASQPAELVDPEDPHKGRWGGLSRSNGLQLTAVVSPVSDDWFSIELTVRSSARGALSGPVTFHLHPTFKPAVVTVDPTEDQAVLRLSGWGAFTVGVTANEGRTRLELDLSELREAPERFRER